MRPEGPQGVRRGGGLFVASPTLHFSVFWPPPQFWQKPLCPWRKRDPVRSGVSYNEVSPEMNRGRA